MQNESSRQLEFVEATTDTQPEHMSLICKLSALLPLLKHALVETKKTKMWNAVKGNTQAHWLLQRKSNHLRISWPFMHQQQASNISLWKLYR